MQRVLVIEEDIDIVVRLSQNLKKMGCNTVESIDNISKAIEALSSCTFDLILIDIDNSEALHSIKQFYKQECYSHTAKIYLVSFRDDDFLSKIDDIVGFVLKPVRLEEFGIDSADTSNETIRAIYRDLGHGYIYNISSAELLLDSKPIHLTKREKTLLELMIKSNNKIISTEQILYSVWDEKVVSDKTIRTLIKQLNDKFDFNFIQNVYGQGYKTDTIEHIHQ
jgi:DNA-binding response OmpR family regulator